jgi:hypothetical protein
MSAFPPIATELRTSLLVRFVPKSGHPRIRRDCPLSVLIPLDVAHDSGMISPTIPG